MQKSQRSMLCQRTSRQTRGKIDLESFEKFWPRWSHWEAAYTRGLWEVNALSVLLNVDQLNRRLLPKYGCCCWTVYSVRGQYTTWCRNRLSAIHITPDSEVFVIFSPLNFLVKSRRPSGLVIMSAFADSQRFRLFSAGVSVSCIV